MKYVDNVWEAVAGRYFAYVPMNTANFSFIDL
jgi:hypothetical protein